MRCGKECYSRDTTCVWLFSVMVSTRSESRVAELRLAFCGFVSDPAILGYKRFSTGRGVSSYVFSSTFAIKGPCLTEISLRMAVFESLSILSVSLSDVMKSRAFLRSLVLPKSSIMSFRILLDIMRLMLWNLLRKSSETKSSTSSIVW